MNISTTTTLNTSETLNGSSFNLVYLIPIKALLSLFTIILNALIILIVFVLIKIKTFSNILFAANALSDLLIGTVSIPFMIIYTTNQYWTLGKNLCLFWIIIDFSVSSISIYTYFAIALHRYIQIKSSFRTSEIMNCKKTLIIIAIWFFNYSFWIISVVLITRSDFDEQGCYFTYTFSYVIVSDFIAFLVPIMGSFVVNVLAYFEIKEKMKNKNRLKNIYKTGSFTLQPTRFRNNQVSTITNSVSASENLSQSQKSQHSNVSSQHSRDLIEKETKAWICLCVVSGAQCILYSVFCVSWPIKAYRNEMVGDFIIEISYWLAYIYSSLNPCLLLIFHERFRTELKKFFKRLGN